MTRRHLGVLAAAGLFAVSATARADDFGKLLQGAARDALRQQLTPENLRRNLAPQPDRGDVYTVKTADGWTLVANRYPPAGAPRPGARPVILCHGLTYNALFWDLDPNCSLARYLSGLGYDVWSVNLRGCGPSQKWVFRMEDATGALVGGAIRRLSKGKLGPAGYATVDPRFARWSLDEHIAYDLPAFVNLVRQQTGAPDVTWVGHSMGGIIALCHLSRYQNPGIGRLVTVGSQVTMPEGQLALQFLGEMLLNRQQQLTGQIDAEEVMRRTQQSIQNLFFNIRNVDPKVFEALTSWATDVPAIGLMQQYTALATKGELYDAKKQFNYARALGNVRVPIFISCGALDAFAPPTVQQYLHAHVGSTDKTLVIFGRSMGFAADAGHDDALVGLNSRAQVFPTIERWIASRP